jgi:hypothetical protein
MIIPPFEVTRPIIPQEFTPLTVTADVAAVSIDPGGSLSQYVTSMILSVPTGEAQPAFLGNGTVVAGLGIEIPVGIPIAIAKDQTRQLYELQEPLWKRWIALICQMEPPRSIPLVCFDTSQYFVAAAAATVVNIMLFPEPYV